MARRIFEVIYSRRKPILAYYLVIFLGICFMTRFVNIPEALYLTILTAPISLGVLAVIYLVIGGNKDV